MLRRLIHWRISAAEKLLGVPADYMRHMVDVSVPAFLRFVKIMPLANYRRNVPATAWHVARLVAVRAEDCGSCVQIEVNLAKRDKVPTTVIEAVLAERPEDLPAELADAYHFAMEVVRRTGGEQQYRERIRQRFGEAGLIELSMTIAACRVFPVTKRGMGFAKSCSVVRVSV